MFSGKNFYHYAHSMWLVIAIASPLACSAQSTLSPPRQDSSSATGVSYRNGTLGRTEEDLSVAGGMPTGLSLSRIYNSEGTFGPGPGYNWSFSNDGYVSSEPLPIPPDDNPPLTGREPYIYNVVLNGKSVGFTGGSVYVGGTNGTRTGGPVGSYQPALPSGASLVFNGTTSAGYYTFTDSDGTVVNFATPASGHISNWTMPDGTRLDYVYASAVLKAIISNRGWAILFESATKVCAVNMAQTYVTASSSCPTDAQTVTYNTTAGSYNPYIQLLNSATRSGSTTTYTYNSKDHLNCVKDPGQSVCKLQSSYTECAEDPLVLGKQITLHLHDYVTSQEDASGKTYAFAYSIPYNGYAVNCPKWQGDANPDYRAFESSTATLTESGTISTVLTVDASGMPSTIKDPINRTTGFLLSNIAGPWGSYIMDTTIRGVVAPEGNTEEYLFDGRGNITTKTMKAKSGSGLSNIVMSASYPSSCANIKTCNKPTTTTDANGNVSSFTYDPTHGGVLTETGPTDPVGVSPVKRYAYVQRYAWIRNAGGGYSQVSTPVWLLDETRTCRTSATVSGACAAGSWDEVVTKYDYGPNTGAIGNNLLLRGMAVTADSVTLRTCYGYDKDGNRIFETKPRAGLASCS